MKSNSKTVEINEFIFPLYRYAVLLVCYTLLRIAFYCFNVGLFPNVTFESFWTLLYGGIRFDLSALTYLNLLYFSCYYLGFKARRNIGYKRFLECTFYIPNTIGIAMNCIDFVYYRFILKRTTYNVLDILQNEENMGSLWGQFLIDYWYVFLFFGVFMICFVWVIRRVKMHETIQRTWVNVVVSVLVFAVIAGLSVAAIRGGFRHSTRPIAMSNAAAYTNSPEESAIVLNTPFSFIRTIGKKSFQKMTFFADDEIEQVFTPIHEAIIDTTTNSQTKKNVVIFIMESFSREFLGCMNPTLENGQYEGYTPFLDSLSQHCLIYTNAYANGRKSIDAMPSVLASIPALTMPYVVSQYSGNRINSIASLLKEDGYQTAFFHGAPNGSMGFDGFAKIAGFDSYFGKTEYGNDEHYDGIWGIWDHHFFQRYADEMNSMKEPFCTALFSLSSHHPFKVPAEFEGVFREGPLPVEKCIGYSDNALRMFFEKARKMPWFDNTLFVITADHSSIPDHEEYKNNAQAFAVPIFFYCPGDSALHGIDTRPAQQIDIMPSILSYLGYNKPFVSFGVNLFDENAERFVVNYNNDVYQIIKNDTIAYFDGKKIFGAYDMIHDPSLKNNIYQNGRVERADSLVRAFVQQFNNRMIQDNLTIEK